jgi:alkylation response protein AidB-like acyl-CoA dehydrogenase
VVEYRSDSDTIVETLIVKAYSRTRLPIMRQTLNFLLNDWLKVTDLNQRARFADHNAESFAAVLDTCERIAKEKFAPFNRLVDEQEPRTETMVDGSLRVVLPQATFEARKAYAESGMLAAAQDYDMGGMQLPYTVEAAANALFAMASVSIGSNLLTVGNANAILVHGTQAQKDVFAANELNGRWSGTMCLSEPQAGSSLSDITTRAAPDGEQFDADPLGPRYRLRGNKMWISSGEHDLTENIIHLVLAKIPDAQGKLVAGVRGISLFIVPKKLVNVQGKLTGVRNDVSLAGLNHKCGWRGTTNTLLNFGEGQFPVDGAAGAVGYLIGKPGEGLKCMFHMMNEARIGIGMAATMLGMAGYKVSLDYAKQRPQGRAMTTGGKDSSSPQSMIIEHADVKRMLLAQKSYSEGAFALALYCAKLVDEQHTGTPESAAQAALLLDMLTPIAKSWPSEWCLEANSLAIQVLGGYGYTRDYPVEQYWRDNRLNMIHEGTHGIQALDLLGRKVTMQGGAGLKALAATMLATAHSAIQVPTLANHAKALQHAIQAVASATQAAWAGGDPHTALPNAVPYMQAFGHVVLAWVWLDVTMTAQAISESSFKQGKLAACDFFFHYELPKIGAWLQVVSQQDMTCANMQADWF